jgi:predicted enzyme related to lactoylglutathione lyase
MVVDARTSTPRTEYQGRVYPMGGTVVSGPVDVPYSRVVQITDPQGASVTLSQFKMPE